MIRKFKVRKEGNDLIIEKLTFPHMNLKVDFNKPIPEVNDITIMEECSASDINKGIQEIGSFIKKYFHKLYKVIFYAGFSMGITNL